MDEPTKTSYCFRPFRLDAHKRVLFRDDEPVPLAPKAFDLLLVLVENRDRVLVKDELMQKVWPDQIVEDANITVNMSALRKALGENPHEHLYIVTIPGRGYRFVAAVSELQDAPMPARDTPRVIVEPEEDDRVNLVGIPADFLPSAARRGMPVKLLVMGLLVVALAAVLAVLYVSRRQTPSTRSMVSSMAVLPFKLINAESDDEYIGLGIADALITRLGRLDKIIVRPTSDGRKYNNDERDTVAVGRELKVESVLEGGIQRVGDRVRLTVQLIGVEDGKHLWADQFDEKFTDLLAVEERISERAANALALELSAEERQRLVRRDTTNAEAYQFYLRGRYYWNKRTADATKKAIEQFQQAIDRDSNYALGYVGLADCYSLLELDTGLPASETLPKARAAVDHALQLDDSLAEAHASSGNIYQKLWRWPEAEEEYKRAISLNPNYPTAHQWFSVYLRIRRQFGEGMSEGKLAQELDPISPGISENIAVIHILKNDLNAAIEQCKRIIELDPSYPGAHHRLGNAYIKQRRYDEAAAELQKAVESSGRTSRYLSALGYGYAIAGRRVEALRILKQLEERYAKRESIGMYLATVYAGLGDKDRAFAWLEKDFQQRSGELPTISQGLHCGELRGDPRYADLMRRMNLVP